MPPSIAVVVGPASAPVRQAAACDVNTVPPSRRRPAQRPLPLHQCSSAFVGGDEAYLGRLLDDGYVSVGSSGKARPKAEIIALARKVAAMPKQAYDKPRSHIEVRGDTAIDYVEQRALNTGMMVGLNVQHTFQD